MVYYDTDSRLQFAREHADWLADEMRRASTPPRDEARLMAGAKLRSGLASSVERLRRRNHFHVPAYHG